MCALSSGVYIFLQRVVCALLRGICIFPQRKDCTLLRGVHILHPKEVHALLRGIYIFLHKHFVLLLEPPQAIHLTYLPENIRSYAVLIFAGKMYSLRPGCFRLLIMNGSLWHCRLNCIKSSWMQGRRYVVCVWVCQCLFLIHFMCGGARLTGAGISLCTRNCVTVAWMQERMYVLCECVCTHGHVCQCVYVCVQDGI